MPVLSPTEQPPAPEPRWAFLGGSSLPTDPAARRIERRGRRWLVVSFLFCPCHVAVLLAVVGAAFGGSAIGASLTGNAFGVGVVLTSAYAVLLWYGFRQIRRAKRMERAGGSLRCTPNGCSIVAPEREHRQAADG